MVRRGVEVFYGSGIGHGMTPWKVVVLARDWARGRRGALAVIHMHAVVDPRRPAVVCDGARFDYGELEARMHRLSHVLVSLGMTPGDRIGAFMHNGHQYLELNAALPSVGGVAVQIGYRLKPSEVAYLVENSGCKALIFAADLAPVVEEMLALVAGKPDVKLTRERCLSVGDVPGFDSYETRLAAADASAPAVVPGSGKSGVMVYTSGTTGRQKGASRDFGKMGYEPIVHFISSFPLKRDERHLVLCPLYHSAAPAMVAMVMGVGGCVVILPRFEPEEVLRTIERERITSLMAVPTMLQRLTSVAPEIQRRFDYSSLRWIMSGAAPLPTETARRTEELFGPVLYNFYGATETGLVTLARPGEHTARPGTIGRAVGGNEIALLDGEGHEVPVGQVGELYVRNDMMMDGYHGNAEATRAASKDGFISVGDLARRDEDGYYYLADRKTDMVISGGVNIYPWEIEEQLHRHPAVQEAAVVGVPDPEWGESLAAFIVLRPGQSATAAELGEHVRRDLADFKRPKRWFFVDELPRNPTGKILKRELKERAKET